MQQQKQQNTETKTGRNEPESSDDSDEHQDAAEEMNFHDTANAYAAVTRDYEPREYDGMEGWRLTPGTLSPSPDPANQVYSEYTSHPACIGITGCGGGISAMDTDEGQLTSLTREEQATDTSYTMLMSRRDALSTASPDGKIQEPHMNDVLCGRGGSINSHPGNRVFRGWVAQRKESYMLADSKSDKSRVTAEVFRQVQDQIPAGRFLQKVSDLQSKSADPYNIGGWWVEIDDAKALAKISQALREGAPAFRALHGKKAKKKQQGSRTSARHKKKETDTEEVSSREKRKEPPALEAPLSGEAIRTPPLSPYPMDTASGHELDVLFPTSNNVFATANGNGTVLNSYPLVHMGDYNASLDEVAQAIPTPPSAKKPRPSLPAPTAESDAQSGKCITPKSLQSMNTPLVSPGFSPYGEAKAAWDAIAFLPNLSPTAGNHSEFNKKPSLQRVHSLSFSDGDVHSIGSFNNPFENDNHKQGPPPQPDLEEPIPVEDTNVFPPPLASPPHGLSFGRIGSVPGGNNLRKSSRNKLMDRESSVSSRSVGSISNFNNGKRKSIG